MDELVNIGSGAGRRAAHRRRRVGWAALAVVALAFAPVACSSDSGDDTTAASTGGDGTTPDGSTGDSGDTGSGDEEVQLTSEDICAAVTAEIVAEATGLEITGTEPDDGSTTQCSYSFTSENGPDSSFSIAATRYLESDAQTIEEAYDGAVQVNTTTAGQVGEVAEVPVEAGDEAVILSSEILIVGILRVDNVMAQVIPVPGSFGEAEHETLLVAIADALG